MARYSPHVPLFPASALGERREPCIKRPSYIGIAKERWSLISRLVACVLKVRARVPAVTRLEAECQSALARQYADRRFWARVKGRMEKSSICAAVPLRWSLLSFRRVASIPSANVRPDAAWPVLAVDRTLRIQSGHVRSDILVSSRGDIIRSSSKAPVCISKLVPPSNPSITNTHHRIRSTIQPAGQRTPASAKPCTPAVTRSPHLAPQSRRPRPAIPKSSRRSRSCPACPRRKPRVQPRRGRRDYFTRRYISPGVPPPPDGRGYIDRDVFDDGDGDGSL